MKTAWVDAMKSPHSLAVPFLWEKNQHLAKLLIRCFTRVDTATLPFNCKVWGREM